MVFNILYRNPQYIGLLTVSLLMFHSASAQRRHVVSGYVSDSVTGERLGHATIIDPDARIGVESNEYGFYSLRLPAGKTSVICSFVGFKTDTILVDLTSDLSWNPRLGQNNVLQSIIVHNASPIELSNDISTVQLNMSQVEKLPSLLGEKDVLKALQLLPGIEAGHEGMAGIYVRGGGPDENLILLDGVPVYNVSHLFGFFSVFTPESIQSVELIKGGFPARYGGRLSSILDIRMKEGDLHHYKGNLSIGLLSSKFTIEGPIKKDVSSFIVSARRTYWDLFTAPILASSHSNAGSGYHFQDLNVKFNDKLNKRNRLYLSFYTGEDRFHTTYKESSSDPVDSTWRSTNKTKASLQWRNITGALRWNWQVSSKFFSNLSLSYTRFNYVLNSEMKQQVKDDTSLQNSSYFIGYHSNIRDWSANWDCDYYANSNNMIRLGAHITLHRFEPGAEVMKQAENGQPVSDRGQGSLPVFSTEMQGYAEDEVNIGKVLMDVGIHGSAYHVEDTTFLSLQPRLRGRVLLGNHWSLKFGFATMQQPIHLLTSDGAGLPTDLWVPATKNVIPETSIQYTVGVAKSLPWNLDASVETYYKHLSHVISYKDGANFTNTADDWQDKVYFGQGEAYGAEFLLQRKIGRLSGWIGYTLSWNNRQFDQLNSGKWFPYKFDKRNVVKLALIYSINKRIDVSADWVYSTGQPITLSGAYYPPADNEINYGFPYSLFSVPNVRNIQYIPERNNYRMRAFHRLDIAVDFKKEKKHGTRIWNISIYNAYDRLNPFFYYYRYKKDGSRQLLQFSLLPIFPAITYSFQFGS